MRTHERVTHTPAETEALGEVLGRAARGGELIGLVGELGADPDRVHSPSFTTVTEYPGGRLLLVHVDLYRLEQPVADDLWLREALYGDGVAAVEWFDRIAPVAGEERLVVTLQHAGHESRTIRLEARGGRHERLLEKALVVSKTATR